MVLDQKGRAFGRTTGTRHRMVMVLLTVGVALALGQTGSSQSADFRVIVNTNNPVASLAKDELSALFLKKTSSWPDGRAAMPVDLFDRSPVRATFSQAVHNRDVTAVKSYWQRMIFSGTAVPPPEKANDREVIAFVGQNHGAIGYVDASTRLPSNVRSLAVSQ